MKGENDNIMSKKIKKTIIQEIKDEYEVLNKYYEIYEILEENKESEDNSKKEVNKNKEMVAKEQVSTIPKTGPSNTSSLIAPAMGFVVYLFVFGYKKLFD